MGSPNAGQWKPRSIPFIGPDLHDDVSLAAFELGPAPEMLALFSPGTVPAALARAVPKRRAEFLAGRHACALSLSASGCATPGAVGRNPDGSPSWPQGFVGSLTHGGGLAAAATASLSRYLALGIDAEHLLSPETEDEIRSTAAAPGELVRLDTALPDVVRRALLTIVFCAKESLFKCLHPLVGEFFEFHDAEVVEIRPRSGGTGDFRVQLVRSLGRGFSAGWEVAGRFSVAGGRVESAIGIRAPR